MIKNCCFCGKEIFGFEHNNPSPVNNSKDAVCCNRCNFDIVIPARIKMAKIKEYEAGRENYKR